MTVTVDYGPSTIVYSVSEQEPFLATTEAEVQARGDAVYNYLLDLEEVADEAAETAIEQIEALKGFSAAVGAVSFNAPDAPDASVEEVPALSVLDLTLPDVETSNLSRNFQYTLANSVANTWDTPTEVTYAPSSAPALRAAPSLPSAPDNYELPATTAPTVDVAVFTPSAIPQPDLNRVDTPDLGTLALTDFTVTPETAGLLTAITEAEYFSISPPELPEYTYLIPEIFTVTGSMAGGDTIVNIAAISGRRDALLAGTRPSTYNAFDRRGLAVPEGAAQYDGWLDGVLDTKLNDSDTVFNEKAVDDCVKAAFVVGTAAHRLLVDIETALYSLEFEVAKTAVNAQLEQAKIAAAAYQGQVLQLQTAIAGYNARAAAIEAAARAFEIEAAKAAQTGRLNALTADVFTIEEGIKSVSADVFRAQVDAERAKLRRYAAVIDSYKAAVAEAEAATTAHAGAVARYSAEVERISTEYESYAVRSQSVQAENAAKATTLQAEQAELRGIASQADASAASASASAAKLAARAAVRETKYIKEGLASTEEGIKLRRAQAVYEDLSTDYLTELIVKSSNVAAGADLAQSISRYTASAQDAISRSATLSQQANRQLAAVYADVYEAAGRAGAAVASGKLSGFRASATMGAQETLAAANSYNVSYSTSGTNAFSESDTKRETVETT